MMLICGWTPLRSQHRPENDHKRQCICQKMHQKMRVVRPVLQICLFYTSQTLDSTLEPIKLHYFTKQGSTRFSFFVMICTYKQNLLSKQLSNTGRTTFIFLCLIWQMHCLLWSFSGRCCDATGSPPTYHHLVIYTLYSEYNN